MLATGLKSMECSGRVEVKTAGAVLLFDKGIFDLQRKIFAMEMKNSKEEVRVYMKESETAGIAIFAPRRMTYNMEQQKFDADGPLRTE